MPTRFCFLIGLGGLALILGCSDSGLRTVRGTVTFDGKPIPTGSVRFFPSEGGRPAIGQIQTDGSYELSTMQPGDGAKPGQYKVAIEAIESAATGPAPSSLDEEMELGGTGNTSVTYLLPLKYSSHKSSGLNAVVEDRENTIDFDMTSKE